MSLSTNSRVSASSLSEVIVTAVTKIKAWATGLFATDSSVVHNNGNETINDEKTFTSVIKSSAQNSGQCGLVCNYTSNETTHTMRCGMGGGFTGLKFDGTYAVKYNMSKNEVTFTGSLTGNASTATTLKNRITVRGSADQANGYYEIATLPATGNGGNGESVRLIGEIGGWGTSRCSFDISLSSRASFKANGFCSCTSDFNSSFGNIYVATDSDGIHHIYWHKPQDWAVFYCDVYLGGNTCTYNWTGTKADSVGTSVWTLTSGVGLIWSVDGTVSNATTATTANNCTKGWGYQNGRQYHIQVENTSSSPNGWCTIARITKTSGYGTWDAVRIIGRFYDGNGNWEQNFSEFVDFQVVIRVSDDVATIYKGKSGVADNVRLIKVAARDYELQYNASKTNYDYDVYYQIEGSTSYATCYTTYTKSTASGTVVTPTNMLGNGYSVFRADADGSGNTISSTYLKLSGGTMSGSITTASSGDAFVWKPLTNFNLTPTANNQEWSFDMKPGSYTGAYWQVWTNKNDKGTLLKVEADSGVVTAPYGYNVSNKVKMAYNSTTKSLDFTFV